MPGGAVLLPGSANDPQQVLSTRGSLIHARHQQAPSILGKTQFFGHRSSNVREGPSTVWASGNEDGPTPNPAAVELLEGFHGVVERVGTRVQGDFSGLGQHHQLPQIVVGADDVPDDVALSGDHVEGWDDQRAAVTDDEV